MSGDFGNFRQQGTRRFVLWEVTACDLWMKKVLVKNHWLFSEHQPLVPGFFERKNSPPQRDGARFWRGEVSSADPSGNFRKRC